MRDIIVIGGSSGGVEALHKLTADFPPDLPIAMAASWLFLPSGGQSHQPASTPIRARAITFSFLCFHPLSHHLFAPKSFG